MNKRVWHVFLLALLVTSWTLYKTSVYLDPVTYKVELIGCQSINNQFSSGRSHICQFSSTDYNMSHNVTVLEYENYMKKIGGTFTVKTDHNRKNWFIASFVIFLISLVGTIYGYVAPPQRKEESYHE